MGRPVAVPELRDSLLRLIDEGKGDVAAKAAVSFGITRQTVNANLRKLAKEGAILATGSTRSRKYELVKEKVQEAYDISASLDEDQVWRELIGPFLKHLSQNVVDLSRYGFTEMVNNAKDHSEGTNVVCVAERSALHIVLYVVDNGIGIFEKIKQFFELEDERHAMLELSKGKLTTDPDRHTGEGIFFSSRMFDSFSILSGKYFFCHLPDNSDWLVEERTAKVGTTVRMSINPTSGKSIRDVFDLYSSKDDDYQFVMTHIPVGLASFGEDNLVSRSQAKRLLTRVDKFRKVMLDFTDVRAIGQGFADEVFRVFQSQHPDIEMRHVGANQDVERMISRARQPSTDQLSFLTSAGKKDETGNKKA